MPVGTVKFFNKDRGFGFIKRTGRRDLFVHINMVDEDCEELVIGQRVQFEEGISGKGLPQAVDVRFVGGGE